MPWWFTTWGGTVVLGGCSIFLIFSFRCLRFCTLSSSQSSNRDETSSKRATVPRSTSSSALIMWLIPEQMSGTSRSSRRTPKSPITCFQIRTRLLRRSTALMRSDTVPQTYSRTSKASSRALVERPNGPVVDRSSMIACSSSISSLTEPVRLMLSVGGRWSVSRQVNSSGVK